MKVDVVKKSLKKVTKIILNVISWECYIMVLMHLGDWVNGVETQDQETRHCKWIQCNMKYIPVCFWNSSWRLVHMLILQKWKNVKTGIQTYLILSGETIADPRVANSANACRDWVNRRMFTLDKLTTLQTRGHVMCVFIGDSVSTIQTVTTKH